MTGRLSGETSHSDGVAGLLKRRIEAEPEAIAVVHEGATTTYRQLGNKVALIARTLAARGVGKGDRVGLLFPNHGDFPACFFAIAALGAVVVPINPLLKSEEIAHILQDSGARAVLVHERTAAEALKALPGNQMAMTIVRLCYGSAEKIDSSVDCIDIDSTDLSAAASADVSEHRLDDLTVDLDRDLGLIVYTSGTTGKPKGAMLSQRNTLAGVKIASDFLSIVPQDRVLAILPLCHIYGLTVVLMSMIGSGAGIVVQEKFEPARALSLVEQNKVTILPAVPAMYQFFLMEFEKSNYDLSSLRVCLSGASAMPVSLFSRLEEAFGCPVVEGYGLTEVSCIASVNPIEGERKVGSVGPAFPGVEIAIFGLDRAIMPKGKEHVGEVGIRGPNVMQGYYKKPEATLECLAEEWFLTGDLGYLDQDSYLYIVGRTKELIIRGGQNIYPREIEEVIQRMPQVAEVAVVGVSCDLMGERVKAFVALKQDCSLTADLVKEYCSECLADYKVPRLVEFIDALPRNSTGKVLKTVLQQGPPPTS